MPEMTTPSPFDGLRFVNSFARLPECFYSRVDAEPYESIRLLSFNRAAADLIELPQNVEKHPDFAQTINGRLSIPGSDPVAMLYAGHQFGHWVSQLGDGRALMLGEVENSAGERWELQLKGAGTTPYSRSGDGRAVLRSTIREYLCSEAMHALNIPTTRALCMVGSEDEVYRERIETGAILLRMAPSHVRFGSFEVFASRGQTEEIKQLADYILDRFYPELKHQADPYAQWFSDVVTRTARMIAQWQAVGFSHGVMNTDNMSILGLTLDYGPYGFLDAYQPGYVCNHSDHRGRYAYDQQPSIGLWNLQRLGDALVSLIPKDQIEAALSQYEQDLSIEYSIQMRSKFGLEQSRPEDAQLITGMLDLLEENQVDYSIFFRRLCEFRSESRNEEIRDLFLNRESFDTWAADYTLRLALEGRADLPRKEAMQAVNPKFILRNHLAQIAIEKAEQGDLSEVETLFTLLQHPFDEHPEHESYAGFPPDWASDLEISCSS